MSTTAIEVVHDQKRIDRGDAIVATCIEERQILHRARGDQEG